MLGSLGHSIAVGTWCNPFSPGVITDNSFLHLAQYALSKEYFLHNASLLWPLLLPLPHRELQWEEKLDLVWPWQRALAHLSRQVSRKIAFRNSYIAHNNCNCRELENQLPILYMEVRCSTQGCPKEQIAREESGEHCWHRLYRKPALSPQLRVTQPWTVTHRSPSDTAGALLQGGTRSSLKDSCTQFCSCSETRRSSSGGNG